MSQRWVVLAIAIAASCSSPQSSTTPSRTMGRTGSIPVEKDRFPHGLHTGDKPEIRNWKGRGLGCSDCHDAAAVKAGNVSRPGTQEHAPCDDCHKAEFAKPPGPLCKICHVSVDPMHKGTSPLQAYPERGNVETLAASFSHKLHLDADRMEKVTGSHISCGDCHARDENSRDPILPGHKNCAGCHEKYEAIKAKLPMEKCDGCHPKRDVELRRGRLFIIGDLKFAHATHEKDKSGAPVPCQACHSAVRDSDNREDMAVPSMERCTQCHEDAQKSPDRVRMSNCGVCHGAIDQGSPPLNHNVTGTRPADHTIEFRKSHGEAARHSDARCRFCHTELSGAPEDSCFQCHQVMRPRDHNLMFRDDHGREAQSEGTRCAQCHAPETCAACHSIPPRSHTPIADFRLGGHAEQARFGLSTCLTCHTYETTCSKCHRGTR